MRMRSKVLADAVHMWLWWSTFLVARSSGSGVVSAFKRAQGACAKLRSL